MNDYDLDEELDLDQEWIDKFEEIDKNYSDFYIEDVVSIKVHFIYVNKERNIEKIKKEKLLLKTPNILSREELLSLLKQNMSENNSEYFLSSILKYNITLESNEIRKYCTSQYSPEDYMTSISAIDVIPFKKTITMFQDLNHLFFLLVEKNNDSSAKNKTKRVFLVKSSSGNHKKTIRK